MILGVEKAVANVQKLGKMIVEVRHKSSVLLNINKDFFLKRF
jgi:hypothetical protein